jgi:hypothetical protein
MVELKEVVVGVVKVTVGHEVKGTCVMASVKERKMVNLVKVR